MKRIMHESITNGVSTNLQTGGFFNAQSNVQVLHSSTTGSLSEVIETGTQENSSSIIVGEDKELHLVGIGQGIGSQESTTFQEAGFLYFAFSKGHDRNKVASFVVLG